MRDPSRIDRICKKLRIIWTASSDQRLGQLIENLSRLPRTCLETGGVLQPVPPNLYDVEDDRWEQLLDEEILDEGIVDRKIFNKSEG